MFTRITLIGILLCLALLWSGCSQQTLNGASSDVSHDLSAANQKVRLLRTQARPYLHKLDNGGRVTAALAANANLPPTIRVDAANNGVRLSGTVQTPAQKALAGKIAKQTLPSGQVVKNELRITAG